MDTRHNAATCLFGKQCLQTRMNRGFDRLFYDSSTNLSTEIVEDLQMQAWLLARDSRGDGGRCDLAQSVAKIRNGFKKINKIYLWPLWNKRKQLLILY